MTTQSEHPTPGQQYGQPQQVGQAQQYGQQGYDEGAGPAADQAPRTQHAAPDAGDDRGMSTEHIAGATGSGAATTQQVADARRPEPAAAASDSGPEQAPLFAEDERDSINDRWGRIQSTFVDEPRQAVQQADELVGELMQQLARMFADERGQLEAQWAQGTDVSTEDLRQGLQRYRAFFQRLLAA